MKTDTSATPVANIVQLDYIGLMSIRLFVLGVLSERPAHGYALKETAKQWDLGEWASVSNSSLYHALEALEAEGLLSTAGVERDGKRPPRSLFRITRAGRTALHAMVRSTCRSVHNPKYPIDLGLAFLATLPPRQRRRALQERLAEMERLQKRVQAKQRKLEPADAPPWASAVLDHDLGQRRSEIAWTRRLLDEVESWKRQLPPVARPAHA